MQAHHKGLIAVAALGAVGWYLFIRKTPAKKIADTQGQMINDNPVKLDEAADTTLKAPLSGDPVTALGLNVNPDDASGVSSGTGGLSLGSFQLDMSQLAEAGQHS